MCLRQTQWDPPSWDGVGEEANVEHEAEMDLGTPTYDENPSKVIISTCSLWTESYVSLKKTNDLGTLSVKDCKLFQVPLRVRGLPGSSGKLKMLHNVMSTSWDLSLKRQHFVLSKMTYVFELLHFAPGLINGAGCTVHAASIAPLSLTNRFAVKFAVVCSLWLYVLLLDSLPRKSFLLLLF